MEDNISIEKLLKEFKKANEKMLEFLDAGVLDLTDDTGKEKLREEEINERATEAELFWRKYFKKWMKVKIYELLYEMCLKAEIPTQVTYYRGMLENCNDIIKWFTEQIGISAENRRNKKDSNPEGITPVGGNPVD